MQILGNMYSHMVMQKPNLFKNLPFFKDQLKKIVDVSQILFSYYERKAKKDELGEPHNHSRKQLIGCCFDLWAAGMETTSTTLAWGLTYLICYPDQAEKLYKELDTVIGADRLVNLSDRPHLPYTNAVVNEVQRLSNIVTQNLLHKTTKDVTIDGYFLPKGTCIIPQISAVLYDEENFKEADKFNPDRFLDSNGQLQKCDQFIPFSIANAKMELFLFLANIFNKYKVTAGTKSPSLFRNSAGTVQCKPFTCRLEHRYVE
uniref:Cytochrome P450 n=1 Tax=Ditylenchus dipsaci TaxID=166011 RepID=A0A915E881_9BILA